MSTEQDIENDMSLYDPDDFEENEEFTPWWIRTPDEQSRYVFMSVTQCIEGAKVCPECGIREIRNAADAEVRRNCPECQHTLHGML